MKAPLSSTIAPGAARAPEDLQSLYRERFTEQAGYRDAVWAVLTRDFFQRFIPSSSRVSGTRKRVR